MAIDGFTNETLHRRLTNLLMENGAAVTMQSVDALLDFIADRDKNIVEHTKTKADGLLMQLQAETNHDEIRY